MSYVRDTCTKGVTTRQIGKDINMDRNFSKDISSYKKDIWKGFSREEIIIILISLVLGCSATYILVKYMNMSFDDAVIPASLACCPVVYLYFKKENGIPLIKVIIRKRILKRTSKKLDYKSSEMQIVEMEAEERRQRLNEEKRRKKKKSII